MDALRILCLNPYDSNRYSAYPPFFQARLIFINTSPRFATFFSPILVAGQRFAATCQAMRDLELAQSG